MATAFATVTASTMKKVFDIFWSEGIGPASRSPSKRSASRGQDLMRTVGRLSL